MKSRMIALIIAGTFLVIACSKVAFTGRRQAKMIPSSQINEMSFAEYDKFLKANKPMRSGSAVTRVRRIGDRLKKATEIYYRANGMGDQLSEFQWEFNVVDDPTVNAFCMPGGKVVVYTGIIDVAKDDDGLAVVMGHEIAHALAHHGNERMTQQLGVQGALMGISAFMGGSTDSTSRNTEMVLLAASGLAQVGLQLPFSRKHESEADYIGLMLMGIAGYDVNKAPAFWSRMQAKGGSRGPEFISTHPSPEKRATNLREWAPEARQMGQKYPMK
ncbi:MAG: M48 family metallopeptidase [Bacteroidota bacterium]